MPVNDIVSDSKNKMAKAAEVFQNELKGLRTGRANTGLVENIKADYYGTPTPIKQMATLAVPQPDIIVIKPFDASAAKEIEKAIKNSDLSIAPVLDGKMVRLQIPPLSEDRRKQLVQQAKQAGEQAKVSVRNVRRDANKHFDKEQKDKLITEDDCSNGKKMIDDATKEYTDKVDGLVKHKSDEIMQD